MNTITLSDADCRWLACGGALEMADGTRLVVEEDLGGYRPAWANIAAFIDNDGGSRDGEVKPLGESLERLVYGPETVMCYGGCGTERSIDAKSWAWIDGNGVAEGLDVEPWCEACIAKRRDA